MKKAKPAGRNAATKAIGPPRDIDDYLAGIPNPARDTLKRIRAAVRSAAPPTATEIISYRIPAFEYKGVLVWFAAFSDHCSFFPTASVVRMFKERLKGYKVSKGTIHFPLDKPLPVGLVRKLVKARVAQNEGRNRRRPQC